MFSRRRQQGFTIIELLFAMSFLTALLILALVSSLSIMRTYSKGLVLKQVNQSGRAIGAEMQRSLKAARPPINNTTVAAGRLCLGTYSYVWSVGGQDPATYSDGKPVGFAKISDSNQAMCGAGHPVVPRDQAIELLAGDSALAIQEAALTGSANYNGYYLYTFSFTLGTNDPGLLNDERTACRADSGDKQFCALNRFRITASARGV